MQKVSSAVMHCWQIDNAHKQHPAPMDLPSPIKAVINQSINNHWTVSSLIFLKTIKRKIEKTTKESSTDQYNINESMMVIESLWLMVSYQWRD